MSSNSGCNNSLIDPTICIQGAGTIGSKLAITVTQNFHGFSAGTCVRWNSGKDGITAGYKQAQANNAYNAEVLGVVSQVLSDSSFELTLAGIVRMNDFFSNTTGSIPGGFTADDVYFLSGYTAGWMDIERPTQPGWVAKPVITRLAEDTQGNIFGSVTNYVGSLLGGNVATSLGQIVPVGTLQAWLGHHAKVPHGWVICDGVGMRDTNGVPGINIQKHPEYHKVVGKEYGWVECVSTQDTALTVGDKIRQTVQGRKLVGTVVGASGGIEADGHRYVFVRQSVQDVNEAVIGQDVFGLANENFLVLRSDEDQDVRSGVLDDINKFDAPQENYYYELTQRNEVFEFEGTSSGSSIDIIKEDGSVQVGALLFQDTSNKVGTFSVLPPDLRQRFVLGAQDPTQSADEVRGEIRGKIGGQKSFSTDVSNNELGFENFLYTGGSNVTGWKRQSIMPPFMTANWIVRVDPNASASILDLLEIKDLKLTDLPTSSSGQDVNTIYNDNGVLKIVQ